MKTGILKNNVEESAPRQTKVEQLGRNTGNLVFWEALDRLLSPEKIPYAQSERLSSCDRVIVTDLIWIRENAEYGYSHQRGLAGGEIRSRVQAVRKYFASIEKIGGAGHPRRPRTVHGRRPGKTRRQKSLRHRLPVHVLLEQSGVSY